MSSRKNSSSGQTASGGGGGETGTVTNVTNNKNKKAGDKSSKESSANDVHQSTMTATPVLNVNVVNEGDSTTQTPNNMAKQCASTMSVLNPPTSTTSSSSHNNKISNLITSNLSLNVANNTNNNNNNKSGHHHHHKISGSGIFSSIKATTLNASKILNKAASLSRSTSPQATAARAANASLLSKKPIDLETHIITSELGKS